MKTKTTTKRKWFFPLQEKAANLIKEKYNEKRLLNQIIQPTVVIEEYLMWDKETHYPDRIIVELYKDGSIFFYKSIHL